MVKGAVQNFQWGRMAESDKVFAGSIPKLYDTLMVPLIFEAYAADLAELVAASSPAPKLSIDACYVVTDLNQPMLDYATIPTCSAPSSA